MDRCGGTGAWRRAIAGVLLTAGAFAACEPSVQPASSISVGEDGFRTYDSITELPDGTLVACAAMLAQDPVSGVLAGDSDAREPVWLEHEGRRLSVIWPGGFSVRFEPEATLRNDAGVVVARAGDVVEFLQVGRVQAAGTYEDPYIAMCDVFGTEYIYLRPDRLDGGR